jgi:hypothetical protein
MDVGFDYWILLLLHSAIEQISIAIKSKIRRTKIYQDQGFEARKQQIATIYSEGRLNPQSRPLATLMAKMATSNIERDTRLNGGLGISLAAFCQFEWPNAEPLVFRT